MGRSAEKDPDRKTIVVLGAHRSGTSVTAGLLHLLGVCMGPRLREADDKNPSGYFEDKEFLALNDDILMAAGGGPWQPPPRERVLAVESRFEERIRTLVGARDSASLLWGWKATTTNLTIRLFLPHLRNPHIVAVFRNPMHAAASSVDHRNRSIGFAEALRLVNFWNGEIADFLAHHPEVPRAIMAYEDLVARPVEEALRIARFLDLTPSDGQLARVRNLVLPRASLARKKEQLRLRHRYSVPRLWKRSLATMRDEGFPGFLRKALGFLAGRPAGHA